jgi:hypothetical protein
MSQETVRPAFEGRDRPIIAHGVSFPTAVARHVHDIFNTSRVYVICSGTLARTTDTLGRLTAMLGPEKVVGRRIGMKSHTLWSEVLEITAEARAAQADLILTIGAGSLTDGAKIIALVRYLCQDILKGPQACSHHSRPSQTRSVPRKSWKHSPKVRTSELISRHQLFPLSQFQPLSLLASTPISQVARKTTQSVNSVSRNRSVDPS